MTFRFQHRHPTCHESWAGTGHLRLRELGRVHVGGATLEGRIHWAQEDGGVA